MPKGKMFSLLKMVTSIGKLQLMLFLPYGKEKDFLGAKLTLSFNDFRMGVICYKILS